MTTARAATPGPAVPIAHGDPWHARCHYRIVVRPRSLAIDARPGPGGQARGETLDFSGLALSPYPGLARVAPLLALAAAELRSRIVAAGRGPAEYRLAVAMYRVPLRSLLRARDTGLGEGRPADDPSLAAALDALAGFAGWEAAEPGHIRDGLDTIVGHTCVVVEDLLDLLAGRVPDAIGIHVLLDNLLSHARDVRLPGYEERAMDRRALPLLAEPRVRAALAALLPRQDRMCYHGPGSALPSPGALARALLGGA